MYPAAIGAPRSGDQSLHGLHRTTVREHRIGEYALAETEVIAQQPLDDAAQIGGRLQVAVLIEISDFQSRPIRDHPAAIHRAARKQRAPSPKTGPKTKGLKRKQIDVSSPVSVNKVVVVQQNVQSKKNKRAFKKLASERDATALLLNFFTSVHAAQKLV